ncbi:hypothetical protein [Halobacillus sp. BBL2006]|uniref:hypothetical protein n=1 Tax=Halobacillus sp. BBL2006 TaxID=1543706 RepID=UPI00054428D0|nr:hypothetical protein [Halobacillus sp. BBL2006]KHE72598.1 hypothetical protein LD39_03705 [Halobacillus sp. BBL2006]
MEQTSWFELVEDEWDPIYVELQKFSQNHPVVHIPPFTITKNKFELFEIEAEGVHDCVSTLEQCYRYLCAYSGDKEKAL